MRQALPISALVVCAACGSADGDDTIAFATGEFTVRTLVVDDQCLDGGLNLLFMPNGTDTPWEWPHSVTLLAEDELPRAYDITLRPPFGQMRVDAQDAGVNLQLLQGRTNEAVTLGEAQFGACVADMAARVQVQLDAPDAASGVAEITMSNPRGDDRCPVEMPAECTLLLSFDATRTP